MQESEQVVVNLKVSQETYQKMKEACKSMGKMSLSAFTRMCIDLYFENKEKN